MKLEIGSVIYQGFIEARVRSSMDTLFDEFEFVSTNIWGADIPFALADDCRILTPDDEQLLDGYINGLTIPIGGDIAISGHDKTFDLISSTIAGTGEYKNLTVKEIIEKICDPFGITVSGTADSSLAIFRYGLNDKAVDVILDLVGRYGMLANSDGDGNIELTEITTSNRATLKLVEGYNIINGSLTIAENRPSSVTAIGKTRTASISSTSSGSSDRYRPNTIINGGNFSAGQALTSSEWIANLGSPESYSVTVSGLYNERPNTLIDIVAGTWGLNGSLLIKSVLWGMTRDGGHFTTFDLVNPSIFGGDDVSSGWI